MLREHKIPSAASGPNDLVFRSRTGTPLNQRNLSGRALTRAVRRAGLDAEQPPTFHELRHAHASAFIAAGGDLVELRARLGHRDPSITASTYSHEFEAARRSAERRALLDGIYEGLDGTLVAATGGTRPKQTGSDGDSGGGLIPLWKPEGQQDATG